MAAKKGEPAKGRNRGAFFKVEGGNVTTARKYCPRCGVGVMMADHKDRTACGKCGYTEFKK